jgi:opacity protein-like surface antigen
MKKIILLIVLSVLLASTSLFSQTKKPLEFVGTKQLGLTASTLGGTGIYYLHPINEKNNFKIAGIYIYDDNSSYSDSYFSIGFDYQRDFYEEYTRRVYFLTGAHIDNAISEDAFFESYENDDKASFFSIGVGVGADLGDRSKGLVFNLHLTYQLTKSLDDNDRTRVGLGAGIGVGFNF